MLSGAYGMGMLLALFAVAFILARNLSLPSGALIGFGGTWVALLIRAQADCWLFNISPDQGCVGYGVASFLAGSAALLALGVLLGNAARRRHARQHSPDAARQDTDSAI